MFAINKELLWKMTGPLSEMSKLSGPAAQNIPIIRHVAIIKMGCRGCRLGLVIIGILEIKAPSVCLMSGFWIQLVDLRWNPVKHEALNASTHHHWTIQLQDGLLSSILSYHNLAVIEVGTEDCYLLPKLCPFVPCRTKWPLEWMTKLTGQIFCRYTDWHVMQSVFSQNNVNLFLYSVTVCHP